MSDQTKVSDLYLYASGVSGQASTNASSRYRAVRNALKRYETGQYRMESFKFFHRASTDAEWEHDEKAGQDFLKKAALINPREPKERKVKAAAPPTEVDPVVQRGKDFRKAASLLKLLSSREHITDSEF